MSGSTSRSKGYRGEKSWRDLCEQKGFNAKWLAEDPELPDTEVAGLSVEVKYRKSVPVSIYKWLTEKHADALAMKRVEGRGKKPRPWLVTMTSDLFFKLLNDNE